MNNKETNYDEEPVYYCTRCLSLNILIMDNGSDGEFDYCGDCGCTHIEKTDIDTWQKAYTFKNSDSKKGEYYGREENKKRF